MTSLRVYYGTIEKNIDITDKVFQTLLVEEYLVFPADDNLRAELFSDPCFRVVKHIIIDAQTDYKDRSNANAKSPGAPFLAFLGSWVDA